MLQDPAGDIPTFQGLSCRVVGEEVHNTVPVAQPCQMLRVARNGLSAIQSTSLSTIVLF